MTLVEVYKVDHTVYPFNTRANSIPSKVNSSFFTRILMGSLMKHLLTSSTSVGIVADSKITYNTSIPETRSQLKIRTVKLHVMLKYIAETRVGLHHFQKTNKTSG